jgi:hypothetical protein
MNQERLFNSTNLDDRLRRGHQGAAGAIQAIPEAQFLASSDEEIVAHIMPQWTLQPLSLQEDAARMEQQETQVDVSKDALAIPPREGIKPEFP